MPQRKSAVKSLKQSKKRRIRNLAVKKNVKQTIKDYLKSLKEKNSEKAKTLLNKVYKELDKAGTKKVIHKNKASRKKSRLARKLKSAS